MENDNDFFNFITAVGTRFGPNFALQQADLAQKIAQAKLNGKGVKYEPSDLEKQWKIEMKDLEEKLLNIPISSPIQKSDL